ncbi:MAG: ImmA/IrrE family metallo-endopeptidase [Actinomycetota bacterium]|nr:ImmA/IrrE family metallo-endopeptidase [Actinomycetota bacterium]
MNRLRAYRDIEGLNQEDLGTLLGISGQMVSAIESGRRSFNGSLAPLGYADERLVLPEMSEPLHRQRASTGAAAKKRAKELLRLAGEVFGELLRVTSNTPQWALERHTGVSSFDEIEDYAVEVRSMLGLEESAPIQNLTLSVERAGVCVIPIDLPGVDGISAWVNGLPVVGLSPTAPGDRFRLSIAHELGHLLMHARRTDLTEGEANRFAGALLFPLSEFDAAMPDRPQLRDFVSLKSAWGVSVAALVYRAHELGYLDDPRYRALQIQMAKWRKSEPGRFEAAYGSLLGRLIEVNGGVPRVADDLGLNRTHVAELVNWSRLRLVGPTG